jgi:hypothetical protein
MKSYRSAVLVNVRALTFVAFVCLTTAVFLYSEPVKGKIAASQTAMPTPAPRASRTPVPRKYSQFPHDVKAHRVSCDQCHKFPSDNWKKVRSEKDAFPDITEYPKHQSCLNCHKQQFFQGAKPAICTICHTNPSPRNSTRHAFPNPREIYDTTPKGRTGTSDFAITFPHDKHIEIVSRLERRDEVVNASWTRGARRLYGEESCSVCHQTYKPQGTSDDEYVTKPPATLGDAFWLKKGTFKTSPIGHTTCFTCHSADSGMSPEPKDCATCHTLKAPAGPTDFDPKLASAIGIDDKIMLTAWRRRGSAGAFRHEFASHAELSCSTCHTVTTMLTNDPKTQKVPVTSCNMCHITATADDGGVLNFEVESRKKNPSFTCVKCHISFGNKPIPDSHIQAIKAAGN